MAIVAEVKRSINFGDIQMKNLLLALILSVPSIALSAKNDGWCDSRHNSWILACNSAYWVTTGQYYLNHKMDKSVDEMLENGFIDCWKMEDRAKVIRKHYFKNFRVAKQDWVLYEVNHKGWHGYVVAGVCR